MVLVRISSLFPPIHNLTNPLVNTLLVSLPTYGWFPRQLPSEEAAGLDPPINSDSDTDSDLDADAEE